MKRKYVIWIMLIIVLIGGVLSVLFLLHSPQNQNTPEDEMFCLTNFQWEIQNFSTEQNIGEVNDKNIAIKNAKLMWLEKYGIEIPERKIKVAYDAREECWHVYGTLSPNDIGGVLHAIIRKNGDLLAVWIDD